MHRILKGCSFTHKLKRQNTYRQIFQLQLTDCIVIFDVFRDEGKFEIGIFKDGVFLLSVRPILGTLDLKVHYTKKMFYRLLGQTRRSYTVSKERAAYGSFLYDSVQHHYAAAPLLPHHLPEVATCIWKGSLKNNHCCVRRLGFILRLTK